MNLRIFFQTAAALALLLSLTVRAQGIGRSSAGLWGMVSLKRTKRRSIGDRRITSDGERHFRVRVTAARSFRMGASLSLVPKTRARSETCTASTDGRANNFGCGPLSFP